MEDPRGSYSIIRSAAPPALIAQGRGAVRPLFDLLWVKPQGDEVAMLLHFFDHGALVEACLAIMADYREDPAVRLKAGLFARQLVGQEAIRGELKDLYRDLYKDPSSPDGVRVYSCTRSSPCWGNILSDLRISGGYAGG